MPTLHSQKDAKVCSPRITGSGNCRAWRAFREELLELYSPPCRARNTWFSLRHVLDELERLGVRHPRELTPGLVARFAARPHLAAPTIQGQLGYLRRVCSYAVHVGHLKRSPFEWRGEWLVSRGSAPGRAAVRHYPAEAVGRLLELAAVEASGGSWEAGRLEAVVWLFAYTGLRRSEGLCLRREDLDVNGRVVYVRGNVRRSLKTAASAQPVPLPEALAAVLERWERRCGCEWLFPGRRLKGPWIGGPQGSRPIDQLHALGVRAGIERLTFQGLRHSWATHAEQLWGLSDPLIQRVLRHTTVRTSRDWYRHPDALNLRAAVASIEYPRGAAR